MSFHVGLNWSFHVKWSSINELNKNYKLKKKKSINELFTLFNQTSFVLAVGDEVFVMVNIFLNFY